jgi:SAM-dependent methyltransferase
MVQKEEEHLKQQDPVIDARCQICAGNEGTVHPAREMMLGTKETFLYWECAGCGCLSLMNIPEDQGRYYPRGYYSFNAGSSKGLKKLRDATYLSSLSFLVNWRRRTDLDVVRRVGLRKEMSFLDVGCGAGYLLGDLRSLGYNARGVDPHIEQEVRDPFGTRVEKKTLASVEERFDVILFRHSLEHMSQDMLALASERLKENGVCVVCIPLLGWAWKHYGCDWVQLDAPRHLYLHTRRSFTILAENSGFVVDRVVYDSNDFQFWGSEAYQKETSLSQVPKPQYLERRRMLRQAARLNAQGEGDTAQFYLKLKPRKATSS